MRMKLFILTVLSFSLAGCSTVTKPGTVNNLQIKVAHLERRLNQKEYEIEQLKTEVESLTQTVRVTETRSFDSFDDEIIENSVSESYSLKSVGHESDSENIIRVSINIETLQKALKSSGNYEGSIDGKIGAQTKRGIINFQKDHDLKSDGIVGKKTWSELKTYLD